MKFKLEDTEIQKLIMSDLYLGSLIIYIGTAELHLEPDGFKCLVKYIIGQQISDKARETIWLRLCDILPELTPEAILVKADSEIQGIGISNRKVEYIKNLSNAIVNKLVDFKILRLLTNKEIITQLTELKGIGRWTAEMYMIFSLGRLDVLSTGDGTIKRTIQWMYNLEKIPSSKEIGVLFEKKKWVQSATIVSFYLWEAIARNLTVFPFATKILNGGEIDGKRSCHLDGNGN